MGRSADLEKGRTWIKTGLILFSGLQMFDQAKLILFHFGYTSWVRRSGLKPGSCTTKEERCYYENRSRKTVHYQA